MESVTKRKMSKTRGETVAGTLLLTRHEYLLLFVLLKRNQIACIAYCRINKLIEYTSNDQLKTI